MRLEAWRKSRHLTLKAAAELIGIDHARSYQRYELGMILPDSPMIERIRAVTDGSVTAEDHHRQRLDWLKANRPELVAGCQVAAGRKTANDL